MVTVFLTRRQYDRMCSRWAINGPEQKAYLFAKRRKWSLEGVKVTTDSPEFLVLAAKVKSEK